MICAKHLYFVFMKCFINDNKMSFIFRYSHNIYQRAPTGVKFQLSTSFHGPQGNPVLLLAHSFKVLSLYGGVSLFDGERMHSTD